MIHIIHEHDPLKGSKHVYKYTKGSQNTFT